MILISDVSGIIRYINSNCSSSTGSGIAVSNSGIVTENVVVMIAALVV